MKIGRQRDIIVGKKEVMNSLINTLLLSLCANYPLTNITVTTIPPWKWVPEKAKAAMEIEANNQQCILKNNEQIRQEILKGKRLKIATLPNRPPVSWVTRSENGSLEGHGIAFQIVNTLSEKFGFVYDILIPAKKTLINEKGGIINMLVEGEVDMIAAFIPVLPGMEELVQWGIQLSHFEYVVMMKRPKESATGSGLLAPFEIEVWLLILVSLIVVGPIIYGLMILRYRISDKSKMYPLSSCVWFVYGALMKQGSSLSPDNDSTRIMFASWWLFIMILTSFYTANLTAFLTLSRFTLPIQTIEDIANPAYKWIASEGEAIDYSVKADTDLSALRYSWREGRGTFVNVADQTKIRSSITDGVLFLHEKNWLNIFMLQIERSITKDHCKFVLTTKSYLSRSLSFVFPKHSILARLFNPIMLSYVESGIIKHLLTKNLPEAVICPLNLGSKERQLRNSDLLTTYAVVITGFSVAMIVFISEIAAKVWDNWCYYANPKKKMILKNVVDNKRIANGNSKFWSNQIKTNRNGGLSNRVLEMTKYRTNKLQPILEENVIYVNGRDYIYGSKEQGMKLVPNRGLSAFLFQNVK